MQNQTNLSLPQFVGHKIFRGEHEPLTATMYEYLLAGNGLLVCGERREFAVCLPLAREIVAGLAVADNFIDWKVPQIEWSLWRQILNHARTTTNPDDFKENLYVVFWENSRWNWSDLSRERRFGATLADDERSEYGKACIELHTHPPNALHFSRADDADETGKFRLFALLADIHKQPKIRFRCGIYNHFCPVPTHLVGAMPPEIVDLQALTGKLLVLR